MYRENPRASIVTYRAARRKHGKSRLIRKIPFGFPQPTLFHIIPLYYFNSKKQGELDFVIEQNGNVLPIEIKSGKDYKRHNALKNVMETTNYAIKQAVVFCNDNIRAKDNILYCPIYMLMFLSNEKIVLGTYKIDLNGLESRV